MKTRIPAIARILFITLLFSTAVGVRAAPVNDAAALSGLKSAKALFLINSADPRKVAHVLRLVGKTAASMDHQGVKTRVVVVMIGPTVAFLTKDRRGIAYQDQRSVMKLQKAVRGLRKAGIRTEACGVALHMHDIDPAAVIPSVHVVGSGFISAIAYQQKGYSLVPVY